METRPGDGFRVVAPTYAVVHVEGGGLRGTFKTTYPDASVWWIVVLYELRGDLICRSTTFFAPEFPAPEWRAGHVERMPGRWALPRKMLARGAGWLEHELAGH